jgi:predicted ATPase with chaperone activity
MGKTMLAERLPTVMPTLDRSTALEVTSIGRWHAPGGKPRS